MGIFVHIKKEFVDPADLSKVSGAGKWYSVEESSESEAEEEELHSEEEEASEVTIDRSIEIFADDNLHMYLQFGEFVYFAFEEVEDAANFIADIRPKTEVVLVVHGDLPDFIALIKEFGETYDMSKSVFKVYSLTSQIAKALNELQENVVKNLEVKLFNGQILTNRYNNLTIGIDSDYTQAEYFVKTFENLPPVTCLTLECWPSQVPLALDDLLASNMILALKSVRYIFFRNIAILVSVGFYAAVIAKASSSELSFIGIYPSQAPQLLFDNISTEHRRQNIRDLCYVDYRRESPLGYDARHDAFHALKLVSLLLRPQLTGSPFTRLNRDLVRILLTLSVFLPLA